MAHGVKMFQKYKINLHCESAVITAQQLILFKYMHLNYPTIVTYINFFRAMAY